MSDVAVAECRRCGTLIGYKVSDNPLLANARPTICDACGAAEDAERDSVDAELTLRMRGIPPRYLEATFDTFTARTPSQAAAVGHLDQHASEGVMLLGDAGCGKTHLACAAIADGPVGSLFVNTTELLDDLRRGYDGGGGDLFDRALSAPLLALDDLGSEAVTDWVRDRLYTLINHRWDHCLPLIVTTNVDPADLAERIGQGVASRIAGCCAHRIRVKGPDGRRSQGAE